MKTQIRSSVTAASLMTHPVETVLKKDSLHSVARLFTEKSISAAAVLDDDRRYVGVITKTDLVRYEVQRDGVQSFLRKKGTDLWTDPGLPVFNEDDTVERWMTPVIFSVPTDTSAAVLAKRMVKYGTHHIFVRGRKPDEIVGIVSTFDLLRVYAHEKDKDVEQLR